jgi:hypothetical protein
VIECARIVESVASDPLKVASRVPVPCADDDVDTSNLASAPSCVVCRKELRVLADPVQSVPPRVALKSNTSALWSTAELKTKLPLPATGSLNVLPPVPPSLTVSTPPLRLNVSPLPEMKNRWFPLFAAMVALVAETLTLASLAGTVMTTGFVSSVSDLLTIGDPVVTTGSGVAAVPGCPAHDEFGLVSPHHRPLLVSCRMVQFT